MKITIPEHIGDITLEQFQKYQELLKREELDPFNLNKRKIQIFTGLKISDINLIKQVDYEDILLMIDKALETDCTFVDRFKIGSVEFGFIPNLDKITTAEYVDLQKYGVEVETLHNLIAILFRPINDKDAFGNYSISNYTGTEQMAHIMKQTPLNIVNGALFFFANLSTELTSYILKSTEVELARVNPL